MRFPHTVRHLILGLALAAALSGTAHAVPLTWIVNGALQQGALTQAFSGSFVFDIDQTPLSSNPVFL